MIVCRSKHVEAFGHDFRRMFVIGNALGNMNLKGQGLVVLLYRDAEDLENEGLESERLHELLVYADIVGRARECSQESTPVDA